MSCAKDIARVTLCIYIYTVRRKTGERASERVYPNSLRGCIFGYTRSELFIHGVPGAESPRASGINKRERRARGARFARVRERGRREASSARSPALLCASLLSRTLRERKGEKTARVRALKNTLCPSKASSSSLSLSRVLSSTDLSFKFSLCIRTHTYSSSVV